MGKARTRTNEVKAGTRRRPAVGGDARVELAVTILEESFRRKAWHGANLRGSIRGLTAAQASWRPAPGRHSIAEIVVHAAYWKYAVRRRLTGADRGSFALEGSNWFKLPDSLAESDWKRYVKLLEAEHQSLLQAVSSLNAKDFDYTPPTSKVSNQTVIFGIASHDVYHTGQIQTLKALYKSATRN